jgi:hypothetical protein
MLQGQVHHNPGHSTYPVNLHLVRSLVVITHHLLIGWCFRYYCQHSFRSAEVLLLIKPHCSCFRIVYNLHVVCCWRDVNALWRLADELQLKCVKFRGCVHVCAIGKCAYFWLPKMQRVKPSCRGGLDLERKPSVQSALNALKWAVGGGAWQ